MEFVDLGLPSGILWATRNVGSTNILDEGYYFQWSSTECHTIEDVIKNQILYNKNKNLIISSSDKYNLNDILYLYDDGAVVETNYSCQMPTSSDIQELMEHTRFSAETVNGERVFEFKNINDDSKFITIPCNHILVDKVKREDKPQRAMLWTSSSSSNFQDSAYIFLVDINVEFRGLQDVPRFFGFPIRPVRKKPIVF